LKRIKRGEKTEGKDSGSLKAEKYEKLPEKDVGSYF